MLKKNKLLSILCCGFLLLMASTSFAGVTVNSTDEVMQQSKRRITGTVRDVGGPLVGVTVSVPGTPIGTMTDADGKFSIEVPDGARLQVSMIGFLTQLIDLKRQTTIDVVMEEDTRQLDEVVVVGAVIRKSDLTGAVGSVDTKVLEERPVTNINQALQGRVAGVYVAPGAKPSDDGSLKIRGINTINSGSNPIYVVDGAVMENNQGGFNSINLNDVESVQVLKDASATALYGSRGANGVIVITTKKGRIGEGKIVYDGWVGISDFTHRPKTLNASQLSELRVDAFANGYMYNNPGANRQEYLDNVLLGTNIAFADAEFETWRNGESYDWLKQVTQTGVEQNHVLSFSAGSANDSYYLSLGYANVDGLIKGTNQDKYTGRINAERNIKPYLKVGTNTGYTRLEDRMPSDDVFNKAMNANPLLNYNPYRDPATKYTQDYLTLYYRAHNEENNNDYNPFNSQDVTRRRIRNRITSANYVNLNILKKIDVRTTFALDYADQSWFEFVPSNIQESIRHNSGDAQAKHERWSDISWQWDNTISYNDTFNQVHKLSVILGTSASRKTGNYTKAQGQRFASDIISYYNLGGAAALEKSSIGSNFSASSLLSYLVRANYSYQDRYLLTGTARYDGSSKFSQGYRWGIFPSLSGAWNIANESFMKDQKVFDQLKLRLGYGMVGNQDIPNYAYNSLYNLGIAVEDGKYVSVVSSNGLRGTPQITWEKQKQTNLGFDMAFWNTRILFSVDAYLIDNEDLLLMRTLPSSSGFKTTWQNIGSIRNKGMEFSISADIIKQKDLNWNVAGNISFDKNKVHKLYEDYEAIYNIDNGNIQREGNIFLNQPLNTIYTYQSGGIAQEWNRNEWQGINYNGKTVTLGDYYALDLSGPDGKPDGIVDQYDKTIVGRKDPKFYGGFSTDFSFKNWSLNTVFIYSYGAKKIAGYYESLLSSQGLSMASVDLLDRWTPENTDTSIPKVITNASGYNRYSPYELSAAIQDASYLRLSVLTVAYNIPKTTLKPLHVDNLRLYFTGSNLFCITPYKGFDPESGDWGYPPSRMYVLGVNVTF